MNKIEEFIKEQEEKLAEAKPPMNNPNTSKVAGQKEDIMKRKRAVTYLSNTKQTITRTLNYNGKLDWSKEEIELMRRVRAISNELEEIIDKLKMIQEKQEQERMTEIKQLLAEKPVAEIKEDTELRENVKENKEEIVMNKENKELKQEQEGFTEMRRRITESKRQAEEMTEEEFIKEQEETMKEVEEYNRQIREEELEQEIERLGQEIREMEQERISGLAEMEEYNRQTREE